jgi:hypothetical protein
MRMAFLLVGIVALVAGCGSLPWVTRDPPEECGFPQDAEIKWAGHGDPVALGLVRPPPGEELGMGEIWVTEAVAAHGDREDELLSAVCYIPPPDEFGQGVVVNTVPESWEPP